MQLKVQQGDYTRVPESFVICFWGSCDAAVTHGEPYQSVAQYPTVMFQRIQALCKEKKENAVGFAEPMKMADGRRFICLFNKSKHFSTPDMEDTRNALKTMWNILKRRDMRKISMHVPYGIDRKRFTDLLEEVLGETDLQVLVRHH